MRKILGAAIAAGILFSCCCRQATQQNVMRWERKTKFRSNKPVTYKKKLRPLSWSEKTIDYKI